MKRLLLFILVPALSFLGGCSDSGSDPQPTLAGTWSLVKVHKVNIVGGVVTVDETISMAGTTASITEVRYQQYVDGVLERENMHERHGDILFMLPRASVNPYSLITNLTAHDLELKTETTVLSGGSVYYRNIYTVTYHR